MMTLTIIATAIERGRWAPLKSPALSETQFQTLLHLSGLTKCLEQDFAVQLIQFFGIDAVVRFLPLIKQFILAT